MTGALQNIRVLDLSRLLPAPMATQLLADFGADVIKIEEPGRGDYMRSYAPTRSGESAVFLNINRNKRSLVLDLKTPGGREVLLDLVRTADVLVESFRPGVMDRLELGYETLSRVNPGLVYCAVTGYGQAGPYAQEPGHDINYLARAGVLGLLRAPGENPVIPGLQLADIGGGTLNAVIGILLALLARSANGVGQFVDIAIVDGLAPWLVYRWAFETADDRGLGTYLSGEYACYNVYEAGDGRFLAVGALEPKFWEILCAHLGHPEWIPLQFAAGSEQQRIIDDLRQTFRSRVRDEWAVELEPLDCCVTRVLEIGELANDPHWTYRGLTQRLADPERGLLTLLGPPVKLSATPASVRRAPPRIGEHTEEILRELGYGEDKLIRLTESGALGQT